jgi:hypothetical protein
MIKPTVIVALAAVAALTACHGGKPNNATGTQTSPAATGVTAEGTPPNCNGQTAVWAIQGPKVYLLPDDRHYGKTKRGTYMCLSQAEADGYRAARRPFRHHHRRERLFSV